MDRRVFGIIPGVGIYVYILATLENISASNIFGWLAFSIAIGSMIFFVMFAPYGMQHSTTVFGREQRYKSPVPIIPAKVACGILATVAASLITSFGFYHVSQ